MEHLDNGSQVTPQEVEFSYELDHDTQTKLVFCDHVPENAERIANEVIDCDVVAIELVGGDEESREYYSDLATRLIGRNVSETDLDEASEVLRKGSTDAAILEQLRGTDKKIVYIDVEQTHDAYPAQAEASELIAAYDDKIRQLVPVDTLRDGLLYAMERQSSASRQREMYMVEQIQTLQEQYSDKKVGVILGAIHTPVRHMLRSDQPVEAAFVGREQQRGGNFIYGYGDRVGRELRFGISPEDITQEWLDREVLKDIEGADFTEIEALSDQEVAVRLASYDKWARSRNPESPS